MTLTVYGLADSNNVYPLPANVQINVGGIAAAASAVTPVSSQSGASLIQFTLPANLPNGPAPVTVGTGTRLSPVFFISIQN